MEAASSTSNLSTAETQDSIQNEENESPLDMDPNELDLSLETSVTLDSVSH